MESIIYQTASQLAQAIRNREVTSEEVVRAHLEHIDQHNERLNAIVISRAEEAIARAKEADAALLREEVWGPLHGVPITVKEAFNMKGLKTTINFKMLKDNVAEEDAVLVTRLRQAGAIILGKTNIPTLLADYQADGPIYGRSNSPYNIEFTPGGSTGGGAAAVAAGLTPLELGSDMGGSVRVPTHFCGLYGLKATENTMPLQGHVPPMPQNKGAVIHMANAGPLARSVEDVKLAFDVLSGPDYRDMRIPPIQWQTPSGRGLADYKLAWTDTFGSYRAGKETRVLLEDLAQQVTDSGGSISKQHPLGFDFEKAWMLWGNIFGVVMGEDSPPPIRAMMRMQWRMASRSAPSRGVVKGLGVNLIHYARALKERAALIAEVQAFFETVDFWLCPVAMTPAFTHRKPGTDIVIDGEKVDYFMATGAFVMVFNLTGHPALVVPLGQSEEGLPIGLQIVGPYWSEPELFHFAEQLDTVIQGFKAPEGYQAEAVLA